MPDPVLALDLGGTKIRAALVHGLDAVEVETAPRLEHVAEVPTPAAEGAAAILGAALDLAERVCEGTAVQAVGISSAGVVDVEDGRITHATDSLTGWAGTAVTTPFMERFGVPVAALNDVHAHGLGEARFGTGRGRGSLLLMAVGTGIGGRQVQGGTVVVGARGAAGHVGHVPVPEAEGVPCPCGRTGHLEGLASGPGVVRLAARLRTADPASGASSPDPSAAPRDGRELAAAAVRGDRAALEAYRLAGRATGRVLGALLNVLDPDVVALTGGVADAGVTVWLEALAAGIAEEAMDVVAATPVPPASAGSQAAPLGAAVRAVEVPVR
ncbi:ROK family protein [Brachybacterium sp. GPGPB12]|uniref:ROK family protein n=1 Tax=Brachybacterium sp. GPGPB12 TaxID=3023517 RepID=UPI003134289F